MIKNIQLPLEDDDLMLSIAQIDHGTHITHEIALMQYIDAKRGHVVVNDPVQLDSVQELFDIMADAYQGEITIFTDRYDVWVDNDNQPMLNLVVDNGGWPEDRADD